MIEAKLINGNTSVRLEVPVDVGPSGWSLYFDRNWPGDEFRARVEHEKIRKGLAAVAKFDLECALAQLFEECKHGNKRHRNWLQRKFDGFAASYRP